MKTSTFLPSSILTSVKVLQKKSKTTFSTTTSSSLKPPSSFSVTSSAIINGTLVLIVITIVSSAQAFNDEKGILKWNPYWFSNFRYSAPSSFYISPNRVGTPYKRISESTGITGGSTYKWSPIYFSGGSSPSSSSSSSSSSLQQPSSFYYGSGTTGLGGGGYMYSPNRPRWSLSDYGGSRFLTRYYGGNSFIPPQIPRSGGVGLDGGDGGIDLSGSNDLSALLGEELMNNGLGLENDQIDILDGENTGIQQNRDKAH